MLQTYYGFACFPLYEEYNSFSLGDIVEQRLGHIGMNEFNTQE